MANAKKVAADRTAPRPPKWPHRVDLVPWLKCYLDLCEQHPRADKIGVGACVPLKQLAECGQEKASLTRLKRLLDRLPPSECEATGFLALTAAEICLDLPDRRRAEKYLQLVEARHAIARPNMRKAIEIRLKSLRALNDLPDSSEESSSRADVRMRQFGKNRQSYRAALLDGDRTAAAKALQKAAKQIPGIDSFQLRPALTMSAVKAFRRLGDDAALARYLTWLDRNRHSNDLATASLWGMGLTDVANKRAENLVVDYLKKLNRDPDTNIHFPVERICRELWFFLQTGQKETAERLLRRILRALPDWPGLRGGFASSGVLTDLAELLAEIEGPEAARKLLGLAVQAGEVEPHGGFRRSALKAAKEQIETPGLAAAIERAGSIKSARTRRETLLPLLAKKAAWPELATLLNEITDADALLDALHTVLFRLPGGARLI